MTSFLRCLSAAFDPSDSMYHLTSLSLSASTDGPAGADGLVAAVTCELPKELSSTPLTWRMYLRKQDASATARELVLPLVESQRAQAQGVDALVEVIRQKDALVSRMLDKLEATGTALEHVFTGLGTRKRVSREQVEARVRGLAPFDRAAWEASRGGPGSEDVDALVRDVFGGGVGYTPGAETSRYADGLDGWWRDMGSVSSGPRDADDADSTVGKRTALPSSGYSQAKSPPRSPAKSRAPPGDATASETGSEDEAPRQAPTRRLGAIGGAKPRPKAASPRPDDDDETASESGEDPTKSPPTKEPPKKPQLLPHREQPPRSPAGSATASEDDEAPPAHPSPAKRGRGGLGKIGGITRTKRADSEDAGSEDVKVEEAKPERKVISKPVKKKRKF